MVMLVPGGTVVVSVVWTIVLGGRDSGGQVTTYIGMKIINFLVNNTYKIDEVLFNTQCN